MSRRNNAVRDPTSALTDFLRNPGSHPRQLHARLRPVKRLQHRCTLKQRKQARLRHPSNGDGTQQQEQGEDVAMEEAQPSCSGDGYVSDNLDEPDEESAPKKRQQSKAAETKKKEEKETAKGKKKGKKGDDDDDYEDDEDEDPYSALSKMWKNHLPKPPVGSFQDCARCEKQFTVTKYTMAANPPLG